MKIVTKSPEIALPVAHIQNGKVSKKLKKRKTKKKMNVKKTLSADAVDTELPKPSKMSKSSTVTCAVHSKKSAKKNVKRKRVKSKPGDEKPERNVSEHDLKAVGPEASQMLSNSSDAQVGRKKREKFQNSKNSSLRERMLSRLSAARFRFINEELYTWDGESSPVFAKDEKSFSAYHSGFKQQTKLWPINPIDVIIKSIKKLPNHTAKVIADFGCGEAKLAHELSSNKVYSFDLVALNDKVTVADNANVQLYSGSVDVAVHCLSLMSSKISSYVKEANRVLKTGGLLKIAEVESRFEDVDQFVSNVCKFNFKLVKKDLSHNLFYFLDFEKLGDIGVARKRKLPVLTLLPCLYKKR